MDGKRNSHSEHYFDRKLYESKECLTHIFDHEVTFVQGISA